MTAIPSLAFTGDTSHDFNRAAYFAIAACFPSPLIPEIRARAAAAEIPAYPERPASNLIPANLANPAIPAGALFRNSPAIPAGAAVPAFPRKPATPLVPAVTAITPVPSVPAKLGIERKVLDETKYESTETLSKFTVFVPCNLTLEAMYADRFKAIGNWVGAGNINRVIADGFNLTPIAGVDTLEKLLYHYASQPDSMATIERVAIAGNSYFKIVRNTPLTPLNQGGDN
jgi:hypothetical protein